MPAPNLALGQVALKHLVKEAVIGTSLGIVGGIAWNVSVTNPNKAKVDAFYAGEYAGKGGKVSGAGSTGFANQNGM